MKINTLLLGIGIALFLTPSRAGAESPDALLDHVVYHTQGWGEMGVNTCAHAPGKEALPLQAGDRTYTSGLGVHAPGETVIALDGAFARFHAEVAVQEQGNGAGSVVFQVFVDDREVFNSGVMREDTPAKPLQIPLEGADELRLVVTDAGDGITCDCANWLEPRLTPAATAAASPEAIKVNVAPFARVLSWDPARKDGTHAGRLDEFPADDLFLETAVAPESEGVYAVPAYGDGAACIGLEWLERRRLGTLALEFAPDSFVPAAENVALEGWRMATAGGSPGGSKWQGRWEPLPTQLTRDRRTWTWRIETPIGGMQDAGNLKVRWVFRGAEQPLRVSRIEAYTRSRWQSVDLFLQMDAALAGTRGTVALYNGEFAAPQGEPHRLEWELAAPLHVSVRAAVLRQWTKSDRSVLRIELPNAAFGVAVDDVLAKGPVYVPHAGLFVSADPPAIGLDAYKEQIASRHTILDEVRAMPDQSFEQAIAHTHRPDADLGPTMISLACDNHKFIVEREGTISFDNDPAVFDAFEHPPLKPYSCKVIPQLGSGTAHDVKRGLYGDWLPIPENECVDNGVVYRQRTFVAPYGENPAPDAPRWFNGKPLCVAHYTIENRAGEPRDISLGLTFLANASEGAAATVSATEDGCRAEKNGQPIAVVCAKPQSALRSTVDGGTWRTAGTLAPGERASCVLLLPAWQAGADTLPGIEDTDKLLRLTEEHWRGAMAESMEATLPDPALALLMRASQVHCLVAARNDNAGCVAPWIASNFYGPLESEGHSVIRGMMYSGHADFARRALEYYIARYNAQGYLTTGYTVMGTGWHLWTLGEYYALTRDAAWMRGVAPEVARVCAWVMGQTEKTKGRGPDGRKTPEYGLMPPGPMADWEVYNYYFYLNGYYCAGLRAAGEALRDIGWPGADTILAHAADMREEILRAFHQVQSLAPVFPLRNGTWVPEYPTHPYAPAPIADFYAGEDGGRSWAYDVELGAHHLAPQGIMNPDSQDVTWMMDHMEDVQFLAGGWFYYPAEKNQADWFNLGGFAKVQPFYARTAEVYALRDDVRPFLRSYLNAAVSLLNREDLSLWEHFMNGAYNKTHETGYFLHQSRLMLAIERGNELWLASFVPASWFEDGKSIKVERVPTSFGPMSYEIRSQLSKGFIEAKISPPKRNPPEAVVLRVRHPQGARIQEAHADGTASCTWDAAREIVRLTPGDEAISVTLRY